VYITDPLTYTTVMKDPPPRKLQENVLQIGENIIFENGTIKTRYGIIPFNLESFQDNITGVSLFRKLRNFSKYYLVVLTTRDAYVYSVTTGKFDLKTRNYNTGTVTSSGAGNRTITLSGGTWQIAWNQQYIYKISFDSSVQEECTQWYTVASINSATQLTITEDITKVSASKYTLRLCYAGDSDYVWHACYPYADSSNDKIMLVTNGIDRVQQFSGDGYFKDFDNYTNHAKFMCFFGSVGYEHVIFADIYDSGIEFGQTIEWLDAGGALNFNGGYAELLDSNSSIVGLLPLGTRLLVYKTDSISICDINPQGGNDDPFFISQNVVEVGTPSIRSVCNVGNFHIFFTGNDVRVFDGHTDRIVSEGNSQFIVSVLNREYQHRAFASIIPEQALYCLFIPTGSSEHCNMCIVLNYLAGSWAYWKFKDKDGEIFTPICKGKYKRTYAPRWVDLVGTADQMKQRWVDLIVDERYTRLIFGGSDGYLYIYSVDFNDDNGRPIDSSIVTKDFDLNKPGYDFRLRECTLSMQLKDGFQPVEIDVRASVDFGKNWSAWVNLQLDGHDTYMEKKANFNMLGKQVRFELRISNPLVFESMTIGFIADYKSMKFDS